MTAGTWWRLLLRDLRGSGGRLSFFVLCLAVGVAAVVAVSGFSRSLDAGIRSEARKLLAADLAIYVRGEPTPDLERVWAEVLEPLGAERSLIRELAGVVSAIRPDGDPGASQLVEVKAVDGAYPFYGDLVLEPVGGLGQLLDDRSVVVAQSLLDRIDVQVGEEVMLAGVEFRVAGVVTAEPDSVGEAFRLGPRVLMSGGGFESTPLALVTSTVFQRTLVRLPEEHTTANALERLEENLEELLPGHLYSVQTYRDAQPGLRRVIDRLDRFLGLGALLSLLVGGVGVAQTVRAWLAARLDAVAVLRAIGMRPREVALLFVGQVASLAVVGSALGALVGILIQWWVPRWMAADLLPPGLVRPWQPLAVIEGLLLGVSVALVFSVPTLLVLLRVPPVRVLRRDAEPPPGTHKAALATALFVVIGIAAMAWGQSRDLLIASSFTGAVLATALALMAAATFTARLVRRLPRDLGRGAARVWLRQGLSAMARPGAAATSAIVALGLGLLVLLTMALVEGRLSAELEADLPDGAPTVFAVDIQPDQLDGVRTLMEEAGATDLNVVPVITGRLESVDGRSTAELAEETDDGGRRWALTREQRLTWLSELPPDNQILAALGEESSGRQVRELWQDADHAEVSVEREFAEEIGVQPGSRLVLAVAEESREFLVSSIREVEWESFGINFYLVIEPGSARGWPYFAMMASRLPQTREDLVQDRLAADFPGVLMFQVRDVLTKVLNLLERVGWAVRFLGGFTVIAGTVILAGALAAGSTRRTREVALLKTLGMTRREVTLSLALEYGLLGLVAGSIACLGALALSWAVVTRAFELEWRFDVGPPLLILAGAVALAVAAGLAVSIPALRRRPIEALRGE